MAQSTMFLTKMTVMRRFKARAHRAGRDLWIERTCFAVVLGDSYVPFKVNGKTLILASVIHIRDGVMAHTGPVRGDQAVESGYGSAKECALNILGSIKLALRGLDLVREFLFISGYVNAVAWQSLNSTAEVQVAILFE